MNAKISVMVSATRIRMDRGETLEDILMSYPRLSEAEKKEIRNEIKKEK